MAYGVGVIEVFPNYGLNPRGQESWCARLDTTDVDGNVIERCGATVGAALILLAAVIDKDGWDVLGAPHSNKLVKDTLVGAK